MPKKCPIISKFIANLISHYKYNAVMDDKKLFLLDAYALIYRAYYALFRAPRITSKGLNVSAVFGFCNTLEELLRKESPSHIAVCFDPRGGTFRHEAYPEYKAQRESQPEDITIALPYIKDIIRAYNIPVIEIPGYEADDVIGTLAKQAEKEGYMTYMMTPDKDYGQLVSDKVVMYSPVSKGHGWEIRDVNYICNRYGLSNPAQVIDMLALEGDASDNVPGCPGVGEKTAIKLITQWGSVENMITNAASITGALGKKIAENIEQIKFSKFLVTIKTDVPNDLRIADFARKEENIPELRKIFTELEFKSYVTKLSARDKEAAIEPAATTAATDSGMLSLFDMLEEPIAPQPAAESGKYQTASSVEEITAIIHKATTAPIAGIYLHANGSEAMTAVWKGLAISLSEGESTYIPIPAEPEARNAAISAIAPLFSSSSATIVSHNVKRDYLILKNAGIEFSSKYYDTSIAHYLLQPEGRHSLSGLAFTHLGYRTLDYIEESGSTKKATSINDADAPKFSNEAADITLRLYNLLKADIEKDNLTSLLNDIELPFVKVLANMEYAGVRIDVQELSQQSKVLTEQVREMEKKVYAEAGREFNISSPMQVGEILFGVMKIDPKAKRTKTGAYSTTEEILEHHRHTHPIVDLILRIRGLRKLLTTYINALPELINLKTGKIHTSFNQTVTATGRISSTNPNLQNIPIRTDDGREIRRAFIADPGDLFLSADYSQIELRLIADISGDKEMIAAFLSGADIHKATAAKIYNVPIDEVTDSQRRNAKTANFGISYGISAFGLSERLGIPRYEAKELISGYFATYPQVQEYIDRCIENAKINGYVSTIKGRKRMLPNINSNNSVVRGFAERNAINAPIQGSAADIIKIAMVNISREMEQRQMRSRMIIQVHDELIFNIKPDELEAMQELITRNMENAYIGRVPLIVSAGVGKNWLEAH